MTLNERVLSMQDQLLTCLQENLRIPSVEGPAEEGAPYGIACRESLDHVLKAADALGFRTENVDGHMGWCEYGEGQEMIAVLGHLDVVPAGDGWSFDPWGGEIKDDRIFGRGTMDDKGPSIAAMFALAALRDSGLPIQRRIRILFGCNEETGARDIKYYLANGGEIPVMGFTPDAEYPVINGEKGIINVTYSRNYRQTGELKLLSIQGGTAANVTPAYAAAKLSCSPELAKRIAQLYAPSMKFSLREYGVKVEAFGVSAHGSTPEQGENAIGRLILALDNLPFEGEMQQIIEQIGRLKTPLKLNGFINGRSVTIVRDNPQDEQHFGKEVSLKIYDRREIAAGQSRYQIAQQPNERQRNTRHNSDPGWGCAMGQPDGKHHAQQMCLALGTGIPQIAADARQIQSCIQPVQQRRNASLGGGVDGVFLAHNAGIVAGFQQTPGFL